MEPTASGAVLDHRLEDHLQFLVGVAKGELALGKRQDVERLRRLRHRLGDDAA